MRPYSERLMPRRRKLLRCPLTFCLLWPAVLSGQEVVGHVVDETAGQPLAGVDVLLLNADGRIVARTLSDNLGNYVIELSGPGNFKVAADRMGYHRLTSPLGSFVRGQSAIVDFELPPDPVEIEGIRVEAERRREFEERLTLYGVRIEDLGNRFIDQAEIERRQAAKDFGEVLQWSAIAGVNLVRQENLYQSPGPFLCVTYLRARTAGGMNRCALTLLDGQRITLAAAAEIPPEILGAIVFLKPLEATLVLGTDGGGGAVLLFTRTGRR